MSKHSWRNLNERKEQAQLMAHNRRVRGYDDGFTMKPAATIEREYQTGYKRGREARMRAATERWPL